MKFIPCTDDAVMSWQAAGAILRELQKKPALWMCAATGNSPVGTYRSLVNGLAEHPELFASLGIVKLDEWAGLHPVSPYSCEEYLQKHLLRPLGIPAERYIGFRSDAGDMALECARVARALEGCGPIDLCILGLGTNGHIGLNEPADVLSPYCHIARLSKASRNHGMLAAMDKKPSFGFTLGMSEILQSRKVILLATGPGKKEIIDALKKAEVRTSLPASFLWLHPDVSCYLDTRSL